MHSVRYRQHEVSRNEMKRACSKTLKSSDTRLQAKKVVLLPDPLRNFADTSYLKEQSKLRQIRDVCTLYAETLACNSLYYMLL